MSLSLQTIYLGTAVALTSAVLIFSLVVSTLAEDSVPTEHIVEIRNLKFIPDELTVSPGDKITWVNYDFIPHTVTAVDESWDSDLIEAEGKWQTEVKADSDENYFCRFHPNMKARLVIVKE